MRPTDDDEVVGPKITMYAPSEGNDAIREFEERAERMKNKLLKGDEEDQTEKKQERGEWMLLPPEWSISTGDPMKSRGFMGREITEDQKNNSLWTETPAEREKRRQEGSTQPATKKKKVERDPNEIRKNEELSKFVESYNEKNRPKSLMKIYQENHMKDRVDEEDPTKRGFDREKDLAFKRYDPKRMQEFHSRVTESSSRFSKGTFL